MKKPASPTCAFGLFGLSGVCGCLSLARWTRQTGLVPDGQAIDGLRCRHGFSAACEPARRQDCHSGVSAVAIAVFVRNAGEDRSVPSDCSPSTASSVRRYPDENRDPSAARYLSTP